MPHEDLRPKWEAVLAKIAAALPYGGEARPGEPVYAIEYASLAMVRRHLASPRLVVLDGPPGVGKSTLGRVLRTFGFRHIARVTDRPPRENETGGVDYHYISTSEFRDLEQANKLFAAKRGFGGRHYGFRRDDLVDLGVRSYTDSTFLLTSLLETPPELRPIEADAILHVALLPPSLETWVQRLQDHVAHGHFDRDEYDERLAQGLGYIEKTLEHLAAYSRSVYLVNDVWARVAPLIQLLADSNSEDICAAVSTTGEAEFAVARTYAHENAILHPIVAIYVFDQHHRLLVQQRANSMTWDHSAAGHIALGEHPREAADRELREELGLTGTLTYHGAGVDTPSLNPRTTQHFFHCFSLITNDPVTPNACEVADLKALTLSELETALHTDPLAFAGGFHASYRWLSARVDLATLA